MLLVFSLANDKGKMSNPWVPCLSYSLKFLVYRLSTVMTLNLGP